MTRQVAATGNANSRSDRQDGHEEEEEEQVLQTENLVLDALEGLQQAQKKKKGHDRTVSWDIDSASLIPKPHHVVNRDTSIDAVSLLSEEGKNACSSDVKVSLKDVIAARPMESEAETYLQHTLDQEDPTISSGRKGRSQISILRQVPDDASISIFIQSDDADDEQATNKKEEEHLNSASEYQPKQMESTPQRLSALTRGLKKMPGMLKVTSPLHSSSDKPTATSTDRFAGNATRLFYRTLSSRDKKKKNDDDNDDDIEAGAHGYGAKRFENLHHHAAARARLQYRDVADFVKFRKTSIRTHVRNMLLFSILPATLAATLLFYVFGNPPCGTADECLAMQIGQNVSRTIDEIFNRNANDGVDANNNTTNSTPGEDYTGIGSGLVSYKDGDVTNDPSYSWWLLFIFVRHVIMFALARAIQVVIIDGLCLRTKWATKLLGPYLTLFVVQSKGWPFITACWGVLAFTLLYGNRAFAKHWLYWQDLIKLCNASNPAGEMVYNTNYRNVLILAIFLGITVSAKRFWIGLVFGRNIYSRYAKELTDVMKNNLLISHVATLARDMETLYVDGIRRGQAMLGSVYRDVLAGVVDDDGGSKTSTSRYEAMADQVEFTDSQKMRIQQLLGDFEEPWSVAPTHDDIKIADIIQFRQSLSFPNTAFPFSLAFGPAGSREKCIDSAERVYKRLLLSSDDSLVLKFDTLALLAVKSDGALDERILKDLVKLFRPDRDGNLSLLDFAKSIDSCYKDVRLLRASVANASRLDAAAELIVNVVFYFFAIFICLAVVGVDPFTLFASISGFILGLAFMIGTACSKYVEGVLFILVRKPFDIGDRIAISDVVQETSSSGSNGWIVKDVTLFTTTVCFGFTNEVATYSNGSLASARVINMARSPKAVIHILVKFPIAATYKKLQVFKTCLEKFVKARPREWLALTAFRSTRVEADLGYVEYIAVAQHRESWQQIGAVATSKADLNSFALELAHKMNLHYESPPLPVQMSMQQHRTDLVAGGGENESQAQSTGTNEVDELLAMFANK